MSDVAVSDVITELSINPKFDALEEGDQIEILNSVQEEICNLYNSKEKDEYKDNTLGGI